MKFALMLPLLLSLSGCAAGRELSGQGQRVSIERAIEDALEENSDYIFDCYYSTFTWKTRTQGELSYGWIISKKGRAKAITLFRDTFKSSRLENCISNVISEIQFPIVHKGEVVVTRYPFVFEQDE